MFSGKKDLLKVYNLYNIFKRTEMKGNELVKELKKKGWRVERIHGSHFIMKKGKQTEVIPVHNTDIPVGLLTAIKKRTGLL